MDGEVSLVGRWERLRKYKGVFVGLVICLWQLKMSGAAGYVVGTPSLEHVFVTRPEWESVLGPSRDVEGGVYVALKYVDERYPLRSVEDVSVALPSKEQVTVQCRFLRRGMVEARRLGEVGVEGDDWWGLCGKLWTSTVRQLGWLAALVGLVDGFELVVAGCEKEVRECLAECGAFGEWLRRSRGVAEEGVVEALVEQREVKRELAGLALSGGGSRWEESDDELS